MVIEFVVNIGCLSSEGCIDTKSMSLGDFTSDPNGTAYQKLQDAVNMLSKSEHIQWIVVGFVSIQDSGFAPLLTMVGDLAWFNSVMYFKKVLGDVGGGSATPVLCGFIDTSRNLRVELENGVVQLRAAE